MFIRQRGNCEIKNILNVFLLFAAFSVSMGAHFGAIRVGGGQLTLFRLFWIVSVLFCVFSNLLKGKNIVLYTPSSKFSVIFTIMWFISSGISLLWVKDYMGYAKTLYFIFMFVSLTIVLQQSIEKEHIENCMLAYVLGGRTSCYRMV